VSKECRPEHRTSLPERREEVPVLEAIGLSKSYGSVSAVRDVTFRLEPGQVLGYLGPNGSGKSTTVKMLTGFIVISWRTENVSAMFPKKPTSIRT
jgi:ABC-type uncharacterized transport system ATPase subunit